MAARKEDLHKSRIGIEKKTVSEDEWQAIYERNVNEWRALIEEIKLKFNKLFQEGVDDLEFDMYFEKDNLSQTQKDEWEKIKESFAPYDYWFKQLYSNKGISNILFFGFDFIKRLEAHFERLKERLERFAAFVHEIPAKKVQIATIRGDYEGFLQKGRLFGELFDELKAKVCEIQFLLSSEASCEWQSLQRLFKDCNEWYPKFKVENLPALLSLTAKEISDRGDKFGDLKDGLESFGQIVAQHLIRKQETDDTIYNFTPSLSGRLDASEFEIKKDAEKTEQLEMSTPSRAPLVSAPQFLGMKKLSRINSGVQALSTEHERTERKRGLKRGRNGESPVY